MDHLDKWGAYRHSFLAVHEEATNLGPAAEARTFFTMVAMVRTGPLGLGVVVGGFVVSIGLSLRKKWPPTWLQSPDAMR